ncbi:MAG: xanthine dehydrogenase family protein molybdopterin-binding subunit [Acidothermales bacterium]|nr:xanthine dehydrogenase family protein molybdopterin-binding subunit [Acidothermales bacterium]
MTLPPDLAANPRLSTWLRVAADGVVTVRVGKVELGQGIVTALAQIAADELDVEFADVRMEPAGTAAGPDEGFTAGSLSVSTSGAALRQACAEVRALFAAAAADELGVEPADVAVHEGTFAAAGRELTYGALAARVDLDREATGDVEPKAADRLLLVGTDVARLDLPDKVTGRPRFVHDLRLPGQLFGRVVRPPSPAATLLDVDTGAVEARTGVRAVVRDGSFLGVVADDEPAADEAAEALRGNAQWKTEQSLPDEADLPAFLRGGPTDDTVVEESGTPEPGRVARTLKARYGKQFLAHGSMAPSCGVARWDDDAVTVWTHSQGVHPLRRAIASVLGMGVDAVTVRHVEGAGCYGHNGADDAAFDAVLLARAVPGRPVLLRWSRADELSWSPFGSAMSMDVEAGVDASGDVVTWSYELWSHGYTSRPGYAGNPGLLAARHLERPVEPAPPVDPALPSGGSHRNAVPGYAFPHLSVHAHRVLHTPLRTSAMRSLGAYGNVFAIESFLDELAEAAGRDPLEYRLAQLTDPRGRAVLESAADLAGWSTRGDEENVGHGIGYARYKSLSAYCAVIAEVETVSEIRVRRLAVAVDVGRVVNPDGVHNQIEGGAVQATSWTLKESVRFDRERVTSTDWASYPILRFSEVPAVDVRVVSRPDEPSLGSGEAVQGPAAAAIGNAVADALGVRVRDLPITPERVVAAIERSS